jgi:hypothetical protein
VQKDEKCVLPKVGKFGIIIYKVILTILDPWDPSIRSYLSPNKDPLKDCKITFEKRSFVDSTGYLWIKKPENDTTYNLSILSRNVRYLFSLDNGDEEPEYCSYRCIDSSKLLLI